MFPVTGGFDSQQKSTLSNPGIQDSIGPDLKDRFFAMSTYPTITFAATLNPEQNGEGIVYRKLSGFYTVQVDGQAVTCTLATGLRKLAGKHIDPVAVGDHVRFGLTPEGNGTIDEVLPRRNKLARRSAVPMPGAHAFEQVIAANVDQVIPVFSAAQPEPKWPLLDRYLVSAEAAEIPALVLITKLDLVTQERQVRPASCASCPPEWLSEAVAIYRQAGYRVLLTSAATGEGLDELKAALQGRCSVLLGKSGVGKTSLLNALQPGLGLRVNEVSRATSKGKHTTTHQEMFSLDFGGAVVDTPGVREFGLWEVDGSDLALFFPEMQPFVGRCRFGLDCAHDEEPGCAVRKAVMAGQVSPLRYHSYLRLREETL
jgi:ribosome biogenesis GTPase